MAELQTIMLANKVITLGEPEVLASLFVKNGNLRERETRQDRLYHLPKPNINPGKRRFGYRAPALYNTLPVEIAALTRQQFKRAAKEHVLRTAADDG